MTARVGTADAPVAASDPHPPNDAPAYRSTALRHPVEPPIPIRAIGPELTSAPRLHDLAEPRIEDLTRHAGREAIGERIVVSGRVSDTLGRPLRGTLVEVWQANAAGRYRHAGDQHRAPLDPGFAGVGRVETDASGVYRFTTIRPGAYPWKNHTNAWRPAHIHFSLFGACSLSRLVTQMYFAGDPLLALDPIYQAIADPRARASLQARFDLELSEPEVALGYRFDIVLRGRDATPMETRG